MSPSGELGSRTATVRRETRLARWGEPSGWLDALPLLLAVGLLVASLPLALRYGLWREPLYEWGNTRFLITVGVAAGTALLLPRRLFWWAALAITLLLFVAAQGLPPAAGAAALAVCAGLIGHRVLPRGNDASTAYCVVVRIAVGFAVIAFATSLLVLFLRLNGTLLYAALALGVVLTSLRILKAWIEFGWQTVQRLPGTPVGLPDRALAALAWLHLLVTGFPDLGHDSLAMHLAIPNVVAQLGYWPFDVTQHIFAVMPMNANWLYTVAYLLGDENAPRLVNFLALLLAAGVTIELGRQAGAVRAGRWAACLLLATPLTFVMSATLFVDVVLMFVCSAAVLAALQGLRTASARDIVVAGMLFGSAVATKLPALLLAPCFVLLLVAVVAERRSGIATEPRASLAPVLRALPSAALMAVVCTLPPYLTALSKTGNPVFPFYNAIFQSPFFYTSTSFTNPHFVHPIDFRLWLDLTFRTTRFLESGKEGALGIAFFVLLPAGLLAAVLRRRWSVVAIGAGGLLFCALVFQEQVYLRYILPVLPLLLVAGCCALETHRLARAVAPIALILLAAGVSRLPVGWWPLYDFPVATSLSQAARLAYLRDRQPGQLATRGLRAIASPGSKVMFVDTGPFLALAPPSAFSDSWHSPQTTRDGISPQTFVERLLWFDPDWIVVPSDPGSEHGRAVVRGSVPVFEVGAASIRRLDIDRADLRELLRDTEFKDPKGNWGVPKAEDADGAWVTPGNSGLQAIPVRAGDRIRLVIAFDCPQPAEVRSQINWDGPDRSFLGTSIVTAPCKGSTVIKRTVEVPEGAVGAGVFATTHDPIPVRVTRLSAKLLPNPKWTAR